MHQLVLQTIHYHNLWMRVLLQALAGEIQRRESTFKGMLGELERITAKCAELTDNISGAAGRGAGARPRVTNSTPSRSPAPAAARPLGPELSMAGAHQTYTYAGTRTAAQATQQNHLSSKGCCDVRSFSSDGTDGAIPAARPPSARPGTVAASVPCQHEERGARDTRGSAAGAATAGGANSTDAVKEEWSWEALMQFERTIKEQHRKVSRHLTSAHTPSAVQFTPSTY